MRVLVAGRSAKRLATTAGAFAHDLRIETAGSKAACIALLDRTEFDVIIACETLSDGSGLEVLSHAAVNTPNALRIFAARPSTLNMLKGELGLFGLFRTLPYPINFRNLWAALNLARTCCAQIEPQTAGASSPGVRLGTHAVAAVESGANAQSVSPSDEVQVLQVVQARQGAMAQRAPGTAGAIARNAGAANRSAAVAHGAGPSRQAQSRQAAPSRSAPTAQRTANSAVAAARAATAANSGTVAHGGGPSRQAQPRQASQARATPTMPRTANAAVATARAGAAANSDTIAQAGGPSLQAQSRQVAQTRATPTAQRTANAGAVTARTAAAANSGTVAHAGRHSQQAQPRQVAQARTTPTAQRTANAGAVTARTAAAANGDTVAHAGRHSQQAQSRQVPAAQATGAPRRAAAASQRDTRIPESEAFRRARAKRNARKLEANSHISAADVRGAAQQSSEGAGRGGRRREPGIANESLAQLARLTTTYRPTYDSRGMPGGRKRAAIFVGSGVFAAVTAAVLSFFMLNANNSIRRSHLPLVASIEHPVPQKVFPWQPAPQQPAGMAPLRTEATATQAADLDVQAEADSEASEIEPGHPGPPPPSPPPPPSEPPSADSPGWVDE